MNKDYAKRRRARFPKQKPYQRVYLMPSWAWMMSGLTLGLALSGAIYWKTHQERTLSNVDVTIAMNDAKGKIKSKSLAKRTTTEAKESKEGRFDFYNLLPNMAHDTSEIIPDPVKATPSSHPMLDKALALAKETDHSSYMIQAGSFRQRQQAEELKAKLAIAGYEASIQTYRQDNRETWHRVSIGPFKNKEHALASQQKLEQAQALHSLIIKNRV